MFGKQPIKPRQLTSVTIPPNSYEDNKQIEENEVDQEQEEELPIRKPIPVKKELIDDEVDKRKIQPKESSKYAYVVACEMIDENTMNYVIRSNIAIRPGLVEIKEA